MPGGPGFEIIGVDPDVNKTSLINDSRSPLIEPRLEELIKAGVGPRGGFAPCTRFPNWVISPIICVGTPSNPNGSLGLDYVTRVATRLGELLRFTQGYHVVNVRSTVVPGTVEEKIIPFLAELSGKVPGRDFGVCMNPEFLRETTAVKDFHAPPFTVMGSLMRGAGRRWRDFMRESNAPVSKPASGWRR